MFSPLHWRVAQARELHYSDTAKVDEALNEGDISKKAADVLCGIIEQAGDPYVTAPSTDDIDQLVKLYSYGKCPLLPGIEYC